MRLEELGYGPDWARALSAAQAQAKERALVPGRVVRQDRGLLTVDLGDQRVLAKVSGRLEHRAESPEDLPVIGDWVAVTDAGGGHARIFEVLPRKSSLVRRAAGEAAKEAQVLAANVDTVFVVSALDSELNFRRIERMLALTRACGATPVVLLTKADLSEDPEAAAEMVREISSGAQVIALSALGGRGLKDVRALLHRGETTVMIGLSGVGKSTLANRLWGDAKLATGEVRDWDKRGRHTTTHRELLTLEHGALLIDSPGLREFGLWEADGSAAEAFDDVMEFAARCRFSDCRHEQEPGCAVRDAVERGELEERRLEHFKQLTGEARGGGGATRAPRNSSRSFAKKKR